MFSKHCYFQLSWVINWIKRTITAIFVVANVKQCFVFSSYDKFNASFIQIVLIDDVQFLIDCLNCKKLGNLSTNKDRRNVETGCPLVRTNDPWVLRSSGSNRWVISYINQTLQMEFNPHPDIQGTSTNVKNICYQMCFSTIKDFERKMWTGTRLNGKKNHVHMSYFVTYLVN